MYGEAAIAEILHKTPEMKNPYIVSDPIANRPNAVANIEPISKPHDMEAK